MDNPLFFWRSASSSLQLKPLTEPMECLSIILIVVFGAITTRLPIPSLSKLSSLVLQQAERTERPIRRSGQCHCICPTPLWSNSEASRSVSAGIVHSFLTHQPPLQSSPATRSPHESAGETR